MLDNFSKIRIIIIGYTIIDRYILGKTTKLSFEAPISLAESNDSDLGIGVRSYSYQCVTFEIQSFFLGVTVYDEAVRC